MNPPHVNPTPVPDESSVLPHKKRRLPLFIATGSIVLALIVVGVIVMRQIPTNRPTSTSPQIFMTLGNLKTNALNVVALDSRDGSTHWTSHDTISPEPFISIQNSNVSFTDEQHTLHVLNVVNGATRWNWTYTGTIYGSDTTHTYVNTTGGDAQSSNAANQITALNLANGHADWHITVPQRDRFILGDNMPYVLDNITDKEQHLEQINPNTGATNWRTTATVGFIGVVAGPIGKIVYAFGEDTFNAIDVNTGTLLWQMPPGVRTVFACSQTTVCLGYGDGSVTAVNAASGAQQWHYAFNHPTDPGEFTYGFSFGYDDTYIVIHASKNIAVIRKSDGSLAWTKTLAGSNPVSFNAYPIGNGVIYVNVSTSTAAPQDYLSPVTTTAFDVATGTTLWQATNKDARPGTPILLGDIVVTANSSTITAFAAKTGKVLWNKQYFYAGKTGIGAINSVFGAPTLTN